MSEVQWENVGEDEAKVVHQAATAPKRSFFKFQAVGQSFSGKFLGFVEGKYGEESLFATEEGEVTVSLNKDLRARLGKLTKGDLVRVTYVKDLALAGTGKDGNPLAPMKIYQVQRAVRTGDTKTTSVAAPF